MNQQQPGTADHLALWQTLERFEVDEDPACALPFVARLARENGWSREHAERTFAEYRKFVCLAIVAGHPVTPSDDVDQAWHLHLAYTRSYWDDLCGRVLGRPLHHGPTRGGAAEDRKYEAWYQATLESYQRVFGAPPDPRVWPPAAERFSPANRFVRVNRKHYDVTLRRRAVRARWPQVAGLGVCLATVASCNVLAPGIGGILLALIAVGAVFALVLQARRQPREREGDGGGCSAFVGGGADGGNAGGDCDPGTSADGGAGCGSSGCGGGGCGGGGD